MPRLVQRQDVLDNALELTISDIESYLGDAGFTNYLDWIYTSHTPGEAFINNISPADQEKLKRSAFFPAYDNGIDAVKRALAYLLMS